MSIAARRVDRLLAVVMAWLVVAYLTVIAGFLIQLDRHYLPASFVNHCLELVSLIWLAFFMEVLLRAAWIERGRMTNRRAGQLILGAILPPLRLGLQPASARRCIWIPTHGWARPSRSAERALLKRFSAPMLAIALLILPVLAIDLLWNKQLQNHRGLAMLLDVATRLIWLAFAIEFCIVLAAAPRKTRYVTEHWVDLVIILLPMAAFLRIVSVLRLGQVARLARTYRMRGLSMRLLRAVLLLKVIEQTSPWAAHRRLDALKRSAARRREDLAELDEEIALLERRLVDLDANEETDADTDDEVAANRYGKADEGAA